MKKVLTCMWVVMLLASALPMAVTPVSASSAEYKKLFDGDNKITRDELAPKICSYMLGSGDLTLDELRDAAYVYAYWNGEQFTFVDSANRTVTIYRPAKRIIPQIT
ncbi:MAG: hypothetical protein EFT35_06165, partial [Methanophagales archaeon ANME-1-THS]